MVYPLTSSPSYGNLLETGTLQQAKCPIYFLIKITFNVNSGGWQWMEKFIYQMKPTKN